MGVISEPPPIPVSPTSTPISSPVSVNCQVNATPPAQIERSRGNHLYASISTRAISGRENSCGGSSPLPSISLTFVPDRKTCSSAPCGHVFADAIDPHALHQKECSKNIGSMSSSCGSNSSKTSCASYVP